MPASRHYFQWDVIISWQPQERFSDVFVQFQLSIPGSLPDHV